MQILDWFLKRIGLIRLFRTSEEIAAAILPIHLALASDPSKFIQKDGRWASLVDGQPNLILGGQIHNSSAWPSEFPQVWKSMAALHANTIAAPVYWEQFEPQQGKFDFTNVDALVNGAQDHHLHLILLWFGTWKNGNMHYVPEWIKTNPKTHPPMMNPSGEPLHVLSANSHSNLEADNAGFVVLMRHLKSTDNDAHTVRIRLGRF